MALAARTFRVFVSSTFSDLKAERDALQEKVYPRLREFCARHGARFQAIDLRWGVSEEASLDQQTMNICLAEIERCQRVTPRPNLIVLLGDRYGWRPPPPQIEQGEFEAILGLIRDPHERALLFDWYRLDENAVPPEYCLQPRAGKMAICEHWQVIEHRLQRILETAACELPLGSEELLKYCASATEQEIVAGVLRVADASEHVFCFLRSIEGLPEDGRAREYLDLDSDQHRDRDAALKLNELKANLESLLQDNIHHYVARWSGDGITTAHIGSLPGQLDDCLPMLEDGYSPRNLCEAAWRSLARVIQREVLLIQESDSMYDEIKTHWGFARDRARIFVGRTGPLAKIAAYLDGHDNHPLAIWGEPGSGKSALMAKALQQAVENHPYAQVVCRFIGATPGSSNIRELLKSLCRELTRASGGDEASIPAEYSELILDFRERLLLAGAQKRLLIFIDGLDQLSPSDNAHSLFWLPAELPVDVRVVVSALPGECKVALERKLSHQNLIELRPMSAAQGSELLDSWLTETRRTLTAAQRKEVLESFRVCGLPLYLRLAYEEARLWKSYSAEKALSPNVSGVIRDLFGRLSAEANHGAVLVSRALGFLAASRNGLSEDEMLDVLSRDKEVIGDFLRRSPKSPKSERLPVVVWSRLYFDLKPYLVERQVHETLLLSFFHGQMAEVAAREYLGDDLGKTRHRALAGYLASQPLVTLVDDFQKTNQRVVYELPYQQTMAEMWAELEANLTDIEFMQAKCSAGLTYDLVLDYTRVGSSRLAPASPAIIQGRKPPSLFRRLMVPAHRRAEETRGALFSARLRDSADFVVNQAHVLDAHPHLVFQQAQLFPQDSPVTEAAEELWQTGRRRQPWLRLINKPHHRTPRIGTYIGPGGIRGCSFSPDGKRIAAVASELVIWDTESAQPLISIQLEGLSDACDFSSDGRVIAAPNGEWVSIWDVHTGESLGRFEGHTDRVTACAFSSDTKRIVSASWDRTLKVWDVASCQELITLRGHQSILFDCDYSPNGKQIVSASYDGLKLWDARDGSLISTLSGHTDRVGACQFSPDGHFVLSASDDGTVRVWDADGGKEIRTLTGHRPYPVDDCTFSPDGRYLVSVDHHGYIKIWDARTGSGLSTCYGHAGHVVSDLSCAFSPDGQMLITGASSEADLRLWDVNGLLARSSGASHHDRVSRSVFSPDGKVVASASYDKTVKLWDAAGGAQIDTLIGHKGAVFDVAFTPDNQRLVSSSTDGTQGFWDANDGTLLSTIQGHAGPVRAPAISPDGRRLLSASDRVLILRDLDSGAGIHHLMHQGDIRDCAFNPTGQLAVSGSQDGWFILWIIERGVALVYCRARGSHIDFCDFSPDGRRIVIGSQDGRGLGAKAHRFLELWDSTQHGALVAALGGGQSEFTGSYDFSPDGRYLAAVMSGATISLWSAETGAPLSVLGKEHGIGSGCHYSPDGNLIISHDGAWLRIWDIGRDREVASLVAEGSITYADWSPSGDRLVAGDSLGNVYLLKLEGVVLDAPWVTPWYSAGDGSYAFGCPWCHRWSSIPASALGNRASCPACGEPVRLNTTTIRSDWTRIAAAWSGARAEITPDTDELELQAFAGRVADTLDEQGVAESALRVLRIQEAVCRERAYVNGLQACLGRQGLILMKEGDLNRAESCFRERARLCRQLDQLGDWQAAISNQAAVLHGRGDLDGALDLYRQHESESREAGYLDGLLWSLGNQASVLKDRGDLGEALTLCKEQERIGRQSGKDDVVRDSLRLQGFVLRQLGDLDGAMERFEEGERVCKAMKDDYGLQAALCNQGVILCDCGDLVNAVERFRQQERICRKLSHVPGLNVALANLGQLLRDLGDPEGAIDLFREQERICREQGYLDWVRWSLNNQADILEGRGDRTSAARLREEAGRLSSQIDGQ